MSGVLRVKNGVCAIWTGAADELPFTQPLNHLNRVKFHSALAYPKVISQHSLTLSLPGVSGTPLRTAGYQLFAHGRPGQPWVLGKLTVQGVEVAFTGSVPVQQVSGMPYARFLALGADATHVWIHEYCPMQGSAQANNWTSLPALNVPMTVYITDEILP